MNFIILIVSSCLFSSWAQPRTTRRTSRGSSRKDSWSHKRKLIWIQKHLIEPLIWYKILHILLSMMISIIEATGHPQIRTSERIAILAKLSVALNLICLNEERLWRAAPSSPCREKQAPHHRTPSLPHSLPLSPVPLLARRRKPTLQRPAVRPVFFLAWTSFRWK